MEPYVTKSPCLNLFMVTKKEWLSLPEVACFLSHSSPFGHFHANGSNRETEINPSEASAQWWNTTRNSFSSLQEFDLLLSLKYKVTESREETWGKWFQWLLLFSTEKVKSNRSWQITITFRSCEELELTQVFYMWFYLPISILTL